MRFLGGVLLGLVVVTIGLTIWSVNAPLPIEARTPAAASGGESATSASAAPSLPASAEQSLPEGETSPTPAPSVAAPGQPEPQEATGPTEAVNRDSAVEGDFSSDDSEVALREPGAAPQPVPSVSIGGSPDNPGLQLEGPALRVNAVPFETDGRTPLIAVILTGASEAELTSETLLSLSVPLTLALVPQEQKDMRLAAEAKLAGYEIIASLPVRAEASSDALSPAMSDVDLADRVAALLSRLWMSVGAMPRLDEGVSTDERFARAFIAVLERNGFAYVAPSGAEPGAAEMVADAFGVPVVAGDVLVRGDVTADAAYAALDRAAETARARGRAILRGPVNRAMLEGLLRWSLEKSGREARIAPLSAVLDAPLAGSGTVDVE